jgi:hypothetical protein
MKNLLKVFCLNILFACQIVAQSRTVCTIPAQLSENSGMLVGTNNTIWLHNDGGNAAELYQLDTTGAILRTITINNATNIDWEDMTKDTAGNVYIGDFGNNNNNRQNLKIYKIPPLDSILSNTVQAEIISFSYPEQQSFPASNSEKKYDAESLVYHQNQLYIFTKDRTNPHRGYSWLYRIPSQAGAYAAQLIDSFETQQLSYIFEVSSAAISPDGRHLALLNAVGFWLFSDFTGDDFFGGTSQFISLNNFSQKEAIAFVDTQTIYITNETSPLGVAQLMTLNIAEYDNLTLAQLQHDVSANIVQIFPNPVRNRLQVLIDASQQSMFYCSLINSNGSTIQTFEPQMLYKGVQQLSFIVDHLMAGVYFLQMENDNQLFSTKIVKL